jgi:sugar lactone lactonase YvrE
MNVRKYFWLLSFACAGVELAASQGAAMPKSVVTVPARVVMPDGVRPQSHAPYAGTVRTMAGYFPQLGAIAYNADDKGFFVSETAYVNRSTVTSLYRVSRDGRTTPLASYYDLIGGITYDPATKLVYATLERACAIVAVSPKTGSSSTLAGGGGTCGTNDGQGRNAQFQSPAGITADSTGHKLYVADHDRLRAVTTGGLVTTTTPAGSLGSSQGFCLFISGIQGVTYDPDNGSVYVADSCAQVIRQAVIATGQVLTPAGQCLPNQNGCSGGDRDGTGANALFWTPGSIAFDPLDHYLYIADTGNNQIRRMDVHGTVTTLAGSGHNEYRDGVGLAAGFNVPDGIVSGGKGLLDVADDSNGLIRTVVASGPPAPPPPHGVALLDPPSLTAQPLGMTATPDGSVWYSEPNLAAIVQVSPSGSQTEYPLSGGVVAQLLTTDASGNIWFSDNAGIGRFVTTGQITVYQVPGGGTITDLIAGPDGNIWFVTGGTSIGSMTPNGVFVQYPVDPSSSLAAGFRGDFWTMGVVLGQSVLDDVSSKGALLKRFTFQNLAGSRYVFPLTQGPQQRMWLGQPQAIGEVMANTILMYQLPPLLPSYLQWNPAGMLEGTDRAVWFTASGVGYIGRMTASGTFTPYEIPTARSAPTAIVRATSGVLWFVDPGAQKIGRWY